MEVGGAYVGDPADVLQKVIGETCRRACRAARRRCRSAVGRRETAQIGDEDVGDAIAIEINDLGMRTDS